MDVNNELGEWKRATRAEKMRQRRAQESKEVKMQRLQRDATKPRSRCLQESEEQK